MVQLVDLLHMLCSAWVNDRKKTIKERKKKKQAENPQKKNIHPYKMKLTYSTYTQKHWQASFDIK